MTPTRFIHHDDDNAEFTGAPDASRINYLNDVGPLLWAKNFRSSVFALDAIDYGITDGEGQNIGQFLAGVRLTS